MQKLSRGLVTSILLFVLIGCGGSQGKFDLGSSGDPKECAGTSSSSVQVSGEDVQVNMGRSPYSGSLTIAVVSSQYVDKPFEDPFVGETIRAQGRFVAVRLSFENNLDSAFQPSSVVIDNMQITDGKQAWLVSDYNGFHSGAPSWAWSVNNGDEQGATDVGAGFELFTWALFDIPTGITPTAIAYQSEGPQLCLALSL